MSGTRRKALGQHFLKSQKVLNKIIEAIEPRADETVLEIGAGKGALTFPLAERVGRLICVEKDPGLWPYLENAGSSNITLVKGDILELDFIRFLPEQPVKVVGNLPYSISTPLLFKIYACREQFTRGVFMLQKEVADRVCASVGTKKLAPLSLLFQNRFETRLHCNVPPGSFSPPPKVDSAVISLTKRETPLVDIRDDDRFSAFLHRCFQQRRKKLSNNLKAAGFSLELIQKILSDCAIPQNARPEQVGLKSFACLYHAFLK